MGNVTLPTPVALAGGAICILGGYLLGVVAGPDAPSRAVGTVESYDTGTGLLCLSGYEVTEQEGVGEDGTLCGSWRRTAGTGRVPERGDEFRFVSVVVEASREGESEQAGPVTVIYGDVVS